LIKQSGELIQYSFWDRGLQRCLVAACCLMLLALLLVGFEYRVMERITFSSGVAVVFVLMASWETYRGLSLGRRQVWVDLKNGRVVIGTQKSAVQYHAANFDSVNSSLETYLTRGGSRRVSWLSVNLHGVSGDLEIARFSDSSKEIGGWSDHAEAKVLRELLSERLRLKNHGVLGKTFPVLLAEDRASIERFLGTTVAPTGIDRWLHWGLKLLLLALALPLIAIFFSPAITLEALGNFNLLIAALILGICWCAVGLIGKKQNTKRKKSQAALIYGLFSSLFAVVQFFSAEIDWAVAIFFATSAVGALTYWWQQEQKRAVF